MSKSGQAFVAATDGTAFTLYAACKAMGIPLSEEQERCQKYLESKYPPVVAKMANTSTEPKSEELG